MSRTVADFVTNVAEEYLFVPIASRYFIRIVVVICQGKFGDSNLMMTDTDFFKIPMGIFFFTENVAVKVVLIAIVLEI